MDGRQNGNFEVWRSSPLSPCTLTLLIHRKLKYHTIHLAMVTLFANFFHFCLHVEDHVVILKSPDVFARNTTKSSLDPPSMMSVRGLSRRELPNSTGPETAIAGRPQMTCRVEGGTARRRVCRIPCTVWERKFTSTHPFHADENPEPYPVGGGQ